ncbi:MAG: SDR family oxidoreductase [Chloroflexota bacterium]|nr:SDR family oxidoreductase [Chloroflexota bacterium]
MATLPGGSEQSWPGLFRLDGRTVLVTAAAGALGEAIGGAVLEAGGRLVLADEDAEALRPVADRLGGPEACQALEGGTSNDGAAEALIDRIMYDFGRLDVVFSLSEINQRPDAIYELETSEWRLALGAGLDAAFLCARESSKVMVEQGGGGKIVLAGGIGTGRTVRRPWAAVAAARAGAAALVRQLAIELAPFSITVNGLALGLIEGTPEAQAGRGRLPAEQLKTEIALGRFGQPRDIWGAALFLSGRASDYVTGQILTLDGGWSL